MEDQDRNSFEPYDAHHRCQALSKQTRRQCGRAASVGRQPCKFHGGASLVGPDHPRYTGKSRYLSKYLPRRLEQRLVEAQQQPDLATLRKELGLLDLRLNDLLQRLGPDTPETVRDAIWPEVYGRPSQSKDGRYLRPQSQNMAPFSIWSRQASSMH